MPCQHCTNEALCDRMGLCQVFAKQQLQPRCPECGGDGLVDASGFCDLADCPACGGSGVAPARVNLPGVH